MKRKNRIVFVGDVFKWMGNDEKPLGRSTCIAPSSRTVNRGEMCEITKIKTVKGEMFVRAKNLRNNQYIQLLFNANGWRMQYGEYGNWLEFDRYFEIDLKFIRKRKLEKLQTS